MIFENVENEKLSKLSLKAWGKGNEEKNLILPQLNN